MQTFGTQSDSVAAFARNSGVVLARILCECGYDRIRISLDCYVRPLIG